MISLSVKEYLVDPGTHTTKWCSPYLYSTSLIIPHRGFDRLGSIIRRVRFRLRLEHVSLQIDTKSKARQSISMINCHEVWLLQWNERITLHRTENNAFCPIGSFSWDFKYFKLRLFWWRVKTILNICSSLPQKLGCEMISWIIALFSPCNR